MRRRLALTITSVFILILGLPGIAFANGDDGGFGGRTRRNDQIWQGLCVGASLDLSAASAKRCARGAQVPSESVPPKIGQRDALTVLDRHGDKFDEDRGSDKRHWRDKSRHEKRTDIHEDKDNGVMTPKTARHAALGDSVAAGLGLTDPADSEVRCGRTFDSYVYEVADSRGLEITHLACTGATMGDMFTAQGVDGPNIAPQLDGAFAGGTPELITITAGANDVRWQDFLRKCYAGTCGTAADEQIAGALMSALETKMRFLFRDIERLSGGFPPEVIITGYYNPLSDACAEFEPRLTPEEINWLSRQTGLLNQTLEDSAGQSGFAAFVPVDFTGHGLCSDEPWVQNLDDPAPFHPTFEGQQAIARAIL